MEIRIDKVRKTFVSSEGLVTALNDVSLHVPDGTVTTLLGPSGCGKTTLLRCIAGLETPDSGTITIGDTVVWSGDRQRAKAVPPDKRGIGMVFQTYAIWPHMSVFDNVAYPLESKGVPRADIVERVAQALRFVQLGGYERRPATALSGGQQQRVSLARAIVAEPRVILFDEPLSNLDAKLREETRAELRELLTRLAITSLYVTHDRYEALALSDEVVVMQGGNIAQRGTPEDVYFRSSSRFVVDFMGKANFLAGTVAGASGGAVLGGQDVGATAVGAYVLVDTAVGTLRCLSDAGAQPGTAGTVAVRLEFIHVVEGSASGGAPGSRTVQASSATTASDAGPTPDNPSASADRANEVVATVETVLFLGEYREVQARYGDEQLMLRVAATHHLAPGQSVRLRFDPAGCRFLTE